MEKKIDFMAMDFDKLWLLHEELTKILAEKIAAEKFELEKRLTQLNRMGPLDEAGSSLFVPESKEAPARRKYPKVLPKYFNPAAPTQTWSGRGKQPRWLVSALRSGSELDDFLIAKAKASTRPIIARRRRS
jgi:DNA-binding protein H-NS